MKRRIGRPSKYVAIIEHLDPQKIYAPADIAAFAKSKGLLQTKAQLDMNLLYRRLRIAMGRISKLRGFPEKGDGIISPPGQASRHGWYGHRWQQAHKGHHLRICD